MPKLLFVSCFEHLGEYMYIKIEMHVAGFPATGTFRTRSIAMATQNE